MALKCRPQQYAVLIGSLRISSRRQRTLSKNKANSRPVEITRKMRRVENCVQSRYS